MKRLSFAVLVLTTAFFIISCGDDDDGGSSGGSGEIQTAAPQAADDQASGQNAIAQETPQPAATIEADQNQSVNNASDNFSLFFEQTVQPCASCGVWFESAELVVDYAGDRTNTFRHSQSGDLLIKQASGKVGRFQVNLNEIPASAAITRATLFMMLDPDEGIANADNSSVIAVYDLSSGSKGSLVRYITAAEDIKGKGYSKSNPNVPIDFTAYAKEVHGR